MEQLKQINKKQVIEAHIDWAVFMILKDAPEYTCILQVGSASQLLGDIIGDKSIRKELAQMLPRSDNGSLDYGKINALWNYCKHACRDAEKSFEYKSPLVMPHLMMTICDYITQYKNPTKNMEIFMYYYLLTHEEINKTYIEQQTLEELKTQALQFLGEDFQKMSINGQRQQALSFLETNQ